MPFDPMLRYRPRFPILETTNYLVSHSLGAMPSSARSGLGQYADEWAERGVRAWRDGWWDLPLTLGDRVADLLGADPGTICMQPNVTLGSALFLSALDFTRGRSQIVTTDLDFPSVLYLYESLELPGSGVVRVPSADGIRVETEELLAAIDERTRVVALSHVAFRSSFLHDIPRIVERAHGMGALVLLDVYQSAGVVPFSLRELGVDAAVGGNLKWLLGGPGVGFLYVRKELQETLAPRLTGWMAHQDPFGFELPPMRRAEGMARFLHGTPAIPALRAAEAGIEILSEAGIEPIREKSLRLTRRMMDRAAKEGWTVRTPNEDAYRGGVVSLDPAHSYAAAQCLLEQDVLVDYRPGAGIRMAPHFYNTEEEVEQALELLSEVLRSGAWQKFEDGPRAHVT